MKKLFVSINELDNKLVRDYGLSEDILQENAASALARWVKKHLKKGKKVCVLCGSGNNGADGLACARMLYKDYDVSILLVSEPKSAMAKLQYERVKKLGVKEVSKLPKAHLYIDAIFGSGLNRELSDDTSALISKLNAKKGLKLACDVPSGLLENGDLAKSVFVSDATISMGALKCSLYSDKAKDFVGKIILTDLGVSRKVYEDESDTFLLQKGDLKLPKRAKKNTNKGDFGHLLVIGGEKAGASLLTARAGFAYGAGLVSILGADNLPEHIMQANTQPKNATAIACGMGLGELDEHIFEILKSAKIPLLLDADILFDGRLNQIIEHKTNVVLTPHPKEFAKMSKVLGFGEFSVDQIQANKLAIARDFSLKFPQTLVLKGANTIIAHQGVCYINPYGNSCLAKGGSGDVLAGLISSLLAQGYHPLYASIRGSLAQALSVKKFKNSYALEPEDIIKGVKCLAKK